MKNLTLDEVFDLSKAAAMHCGASKSNATSLANSIRQAEAEGIRNVGLAFMPYYCEHLLNGSINGEAEPEVQDLSPGVTAVDAKNGFAHPAFDVAEDAFYEKARSIGIAALSIRNAYYNGVEGYFVRRMAKAGLVGFACTNAAAMVAPFGGKEPVLGTNPLAFGVPRKDKEPLVIDLSTSTTAFVNVADAAANGKPIPDTWALDSNGHPTNDANRGLQGSLQPLGGAKGTGLGLMVEILAAGLSVSNWSSEVPSFTSEQNSSPKLGQFYLAINPGSFPNPDFVDRVELLLTNITSAEGVRLPGGGRIAARNKSGKEGIEIDDSLHNTLLKFTGI